MHAQYSEYSVIKDIIQNLRLPVYIPLFTEHYLHLNILCTSVNQLMVSLKLPISVSKFTSHCTSTIRISKSHMSRLHLVSGIE